MQILKRYRPSTRLPYSVSTAYVVIGFVLCIQAGTYPVHAQSGSTEYQIKAVFLFNFTQFVEWPPGAFHDAGSELVIGVLGEDPFGSFLDDAIKGEVVKGHPLAVKRYRNVEEALLCHVLFIHPGKKDKTKLEQLLLALKGKNILTVGEERDFGKNGGMVRFTTENNKIRIHINLEAARGAELTISSKLLRLAEVEDTKVKGG